MDRLQGQLRQQGHVGAQLQQQLLQTGRHHLQAVLQLPVAVLLASLLVLVRPITFPLACLAGVFVAVLHLLLVRDHHVGTLLLSAAGLLGVVWLGIAAAGILMTITLQISSRAGHLVVLSAVTSFIFALIATVRSSNLPFRIVLQGINLLMTFGMSVVLTLYAPNTTTLWGSYLGHMLLSFLGAALASALAGILVLPTLATEAAMEAVIAALRKTGNTGTLCVSIMLRPNSSSGVVPGAYVSQQQQQQQQQRQAGFASAVERAENTSSMSGSAAAAAMPSKFLTAESVRAADPDVQQNGNSTSPAVHAVEGLQLQQQPSLVEEVPSIAAESAELDRMEHITQPGFWGLKSFVVAQHSTTSQNSTTMASLAGSAIAPEQQLLCSGSEAAAAAAAVTVAGHEDHDHHHSPLHLIHHESSVAPDHNEHHWKVDEEDEDIQHEEVHKSSLRHHSAGRSLINLYHLHLPHHKKHHNPHQQQGQGQHKQQEPQPDSARRAAERHLFMRLKRGVDHIRPLLLEARLLHESVLVEQAPWVRWLTTGPAWRICQDQQLPYQAGAPLPVAAWGQLVAAAAGLLDRVAALEGMLDAGPETASLAGLAAYPALRTTCGIVFAQVAALCASLSSALEQQLQQRRQQQQGPMLGLARAAAAALSCCSRTASSPKNSAEAKAAKARSSEPQLLGICWSAAKQQLLGVLHSETQQYFAALAAADRRKPFKLDPAHSVVSLMFLSTLTLATVESAEKLQEAGQAVLYGSIVAAAVAAEEGGTQDEPTAVAIHVQQLTTASRPGAAAAAHPVSIQLQPMTAQLDGSNNNASKNPTGSSKGSSSSKGPYRSSEQAPGMAGNALLLEMLLCVGPVGRLQRAFMQDLPQALHSRKGVRSLLHHRRFQAGVKVWLACTLAFLAALLVSVYVPALPQSVIMFGFMAMVFTMRERVESSAEMVLMRVVSTVIGAGIGHLVMFNAVTAYKPVLLGAILCFASMAAAPFSKGQFRLVLTLLLITMNSVVLCQYVGCCGAVGSEVYLVGRIAATGGGCLFAMLLNRMLWPWYRNRWALEEISGVLELGVAAAVGLYRQEYDHVAALAATSRQRDSGSSSGSIISAAATAADMQSSRDVLRNTGSTGGTAVPHQHNTGSTVLPAARGQDNAGSAAVQHHDSAVVQAQPASPRDAVVIVMPSDTRTPRSPEGSNSILMHSKHHHPHQQQQQQEGGDEACRCLQLLQQQTPQQLLQSMMLRLAPVEFAVMRDTWLAWRRGQLAVAPVVRLMLAAVQQLSDALAALRVTVELTHQQQQQQQRPAAAGRPASAATPPPGGGYGGGDDSGGYDTPMQSAGFGNWLLFDQLAALVHDDISRVLCEMRQLVALVQLVLRTPTQHNKQQLRYKIAAIHKMRLALSVRYVKLRNQRHRKIRQLLRQQQHQQQQGHHGGKMQHTSSIRLHHHDHHHHRRGATADREASAGEAPVQAFAAAAEAAAAAVARHPHNRPSAPQGEAGPVSTVAGVQDGSSIADVDRWQQQQQMGGKLAGGQQQQQQLAVDDSADSDVATVQYMAAVYALRRVMNRVVAVARCLADDEP